MCTSCALASDARDESNHVYTEKGRLCFDTNQAIQRWHIVELDVMGHYSKLYRLPDGKWIRRGPFSSMS
jgi:hypothetical protein